MAFILAASPVLAGIAVLIRASGPGGVFYRQRRVGLDGREFDMLKFRTMQIEAEAAGAVWSSAGDPRRTEIGAILRRFSLDELPQLWNVLLGDMSLVGPRPNLFNQEELINARNALGIYSVRPGITGLAQIKNIDMTTPELLAKTDAEMISTMSIANYFKYIFLTVAGNGQGDRIRR